MSKNFQISRHPHSQELKSDDHQIEPHDTSLETHSRHTRKSLFHTLNLKLTCTAIVGVTEMNNNVPFTAVRIVLIPVYALPLGIAGKT